MTESSDSEHPDQLDDVRVLDVDSAVQSVDGVHAKYYMAWRQASHLYRKARH